MKTFTHEVPIYGQKFELILWSSYEKEEFKEFMKKEYNKDIDDDDLTSLGIVSYVKDFDTLVSIIQMDKPNILPTICHESVHLTQKLFLIIGETTENEKLNDQSEVFAYTTDWFFNCTLHELKSLNIQLL